MLNEIQARIQAITDSGIDDIGTALGMASVMNRKARRQLEVFVVRVAERPQSNQRKSGPALQLVVDRVGVIFAVRCLNDPDTNKAEQLLEDVRKKVRKHLFGWKPESAHMPLQLGPGDLVKMDKGQVWWMDQFVTSHYEEANANG
jgi:GGDEF domain-containing protein